MRRVAAILLFFALPASNSAGQEQDVVQDRDVIFSGSFKDVPFESFASQMEGKGTSIYFRQEWVEGIRITAEGSELSLSSVLKETFRGKELGFVLNENLDVFISQGTPLVTDLPEYRSEETDMGQESGAGEQEYIRTEEQFIGGRTTGRAEMLTLGSEEASVEGDRAVIAGKISDVETGEPLIGASILIEELQTGVVSDIYGHYSLVLSPGRYTAVINCMGMKEQRYFLQVWSDDHLYIEMEDRIIPINEVTVKADRYDNVRGLQMGFERLNIKTIKEIPVVMGEKDLLKVVQLLPGVQSVGEGSAGFNVRGSAADQNSFYINKLPVYNPSHLFGFFSSFSPDVVKDFSFYKSNIPAKYGGRLASVFDISTIQGNKKRFSARGGISPVTGHMAVEGPLVKEKATYVLSARSTYSDWLMQQLEDPDLRDSKASFYDLTANVSVEPDENNLFRVFAYNSNDRFRLSGTNEYQYSNLGTALEWRRRFSKALSADFNAAYSDYSFSTVDRTLEMTAYSHEYRLMHYGLRSDFTLYGGRKHKVTFGASATGYGLNRGDVLPWGEESLRTPVSLGNERGIESALYIGDEIRISPALTVYVGIRISGFVLLGPRTVNHYLPGAPREEENITGTTEYGSGEAVKFYGGPEPRIALNLSTGLNSSVKLSYNRIRQYLFMLSNTVAISPVDQWKLVDYHIRPPVADQISAGYYADFPGRGINTSVEAYYKKTNNLVEFKDAAEFLASPHTETEVLQGEQSAYGLELMMKKSAGKLNGWISYAYSRTTVLVDGPYPWEQINNGKRYPSNYDKPHAVNLVANYRISRRLSFSSNLVYSTGRPVTAPKDIYYVNGIPIVNYSERNEYRIPDYFRVDLSMNIEGNLKARKLAHSYWMINVYNLTGRKNAYSVYFKSEEGQINGYKMSIFGIPIITVSWNFRLGNYASE